MRPLVAALALTLLAAGAAAQESRPRNIAGTLDRDTVWSGEIHLTGDVTVAAGATLRIEPGTVVTAEPLSMPRGFSSEWDLRQELVEIHVFGGLIVRGTDETPVTMGVPPKWKERKEGEPPLLLPAWLGVVLQPDMDGKCEIVHCLFRGALGAVQVGSGSPQIADCTFINCSIGVTAGTVWGDRKGRRRIRAKLPGPGIRRCRFGGCDTGIYVDGNGRPVVERTVFLDCRVGIGRWAGGMTYPMVGLGPLVDRCDFVHNRIALYGSGSVRNSIFARNGLTFAASSFHRVYATHIDRYHRSHNDYFENDRLVNGDIPLGEAARFDAPGYRQVVEKDTALLLTRDLSSFLGLRTDSALRKSATDGGDPGSFGAVGTMRSGDASGPALLGVPIEPWLVPGPTSEVTDDDVAALKQVIRRSSRSGPAPGRRLGRSVYARFPVKSGVLALPPGLFPETLDVVLVGPLRSEGEADGKLHLGFDGLILEIFWNGRALPVPDNRRRFAHGDMVRNVKVRKGTNYLLVRGRPSAPGARIAAGVLCDSVVIGGRPFDAPTLKPLVKRVAAAAGQGRRPGRLTIYLSEDPYWPDVVRPSTWVIVGPDGQNIAAAPGDIDYDAGAKKVVLLNLPLTKGVEYLLTADRLRDAWGRPREGGSPPQKAVAR